MVIIIHNSSKNNNSSNSGNSSNNAPEIASSLRCHAIFSWRQGRRKEGRKGIGAGAFKYSGRWGLPAAPFTWRKGGGRQGGREGGRGGSQRGRDREDRERERDYQWIIHVRVCKITFIVSTIIYVIVCHDILLHLHRSSEQIIWFLHLHWRPILFDVVVWCFIMFHIGILL